MVFQPMRFPRLVVVHIAEASQQFEVYQRTVLCFRFILAQKLLQLGFAYIF